MWGKLEKRNDRAGDIGREPFRPAVRSGKVEYLHDRALLLLDLLL